MPNEREYSGCFYISEQWMIQSEEAPALERVQERREMQEALPISNSWQSHNNINQPGGPKQEDHVI